MNVSGLLVRRKVYLAHTHLPFGTLAGRSYECKLYSTFRKHPTMPSIRDHMSPLVKKNNNSHEQVITKLNFFLILKEMIFIASISTSA